MSARLCTLLALVVLFHHPSAARGEDARRPIGHGYRRIAAAIRNKNLPTLWAENYIWRNPDGTLPSRQEFERVWRADFAAVSTYTSVSFSLEKLTISGQRAVAVTRRTVFYVPQGSREEQVEASRSRDIGEHGQNGPRFVYREALPGALTGRVLPGSPPSPDCPRLRRLEHSLRSGGPGVLRAFWREMRPPLVEPIPDAPARFRVTFPRQGSADKTRQVKLRGGLPSEEAKPLTLPPGADVWYRTERLPADARLAYILRVTARVKRPVEGVSAHAVWAETSTPGTHSQQHPAAC